VRAIGFAVPRRHIEFRAELRLYAARPILEFGFRSRQVPYHYVEPLWSQHHEAERNHEQTFRSKAHDSPLGQALVVGNGARCANRLLFVFHG
jgi:hypothetical protein